MTPAELIAALEAATGPSRELDVALFASVGMSDLQERHCAQWITNNKDRGVTRDHYLFAWAPRYTASIDAAMTLMPANHWWMVMGTAAKCGAYAAYGATPAIALCAAALKARKETT